MSAIATHAYVPCTHPGAHGYSDGICERCRLSAGDRAHAAPPVVVVGSPIADRDPIGWTIVATIPGRPTAPVPAPTDWQAADFSIALAGMLMSDAVDIRPFGIGGESEIVAVGALRQHLSRATNRRLVYVSAAMMRDGHDASQPHTGGCDTCERLAFLEDEMSARS